MKKNTLIVHAIALLSSHITLAHQSVVGFQTKILPAPLDLKIDYQIAYGCIGSGCGQFQGKRDCEGNIVGGCIGSGAKQKTPLGSGMPSAAPCGPENACDTCSCRRGEKPKSPGS